MTVLPLIYDRDAMSARASEPCADAQASGLVLMFNIQCAYRSRNLGPLAQALVLRSPAHTADHNGLGDQPEKPSLRVHDQG